MGFLAQLAAEIRAVISAPDYLDAVPVSSTNVARVGLSESIRGAGESGALLVEYKRVSPGASDPRLPRWTVPQFVRATETAGVAGYSCLATAPRFEGSPADVAQLGRSTSRPVLFKDFVLEPVQIEAAARSGASAVLLIARLEAEGLLGAPLSDLARLAHARGLEVLLEFHDRSELRRSDGVSADMFGVNVRDLDTLRLERSVAEATLRAATDLRPLLGLSGVGSPEDARRFWDAGADGVLVGSAVARSPDPAAFLRSLRRPGTGGRA